MKIAKYITNQRLFCKQMNLHKTNAILYYTINYTITLGDSVVRETMATVCIYSCN